jgi:hypothetical protein
MPVGRKLGFTNRAAWPEYGPMWGYVYNRTVRTRRERRFYAPSIRVPNAVWLVEKVW